MFHVRPLLPAAFLIAVLALAGAPARAAAPPKKSLSTRVAEQEKEIVRQQVLLEQAKAELAAQAAVADSQNVHQKALEAKIERLEVQLAETNQKLADLQAVAGQASWGDSLELRLKKLEKETAKLPELPPDIVSAGDFPGSIRIPGTDAAVKFGGRIRTAIVFTLDPLGTTDRFLTNSIPVGAEQIGEAKRTDISARASRFNIEFRTPSGIGQVRAFFEGDFAGEANAFRLRHAYAQYAGLVMGQTWSTFSDPRTNVEELDFEGISSENVIRQPQVRYGWTTKKGWKAAAAIETPSVSLTGAAGVNLIPDLVARGTWDFTDDGHFQAAGVLRQVRGQVSSGDVESDLGWGVSASGVIPLRKDDGSPLNRLLFQLNLGEGIARYINDLGSLGGQDGVYDSTSHELKALPAVGWYVAFEHSWKHWKTVSGLNLRSTVLWSRVDVHNLDFQSPDSYNITNRFSANLVMSTEKHADFGLEFIHGRRENKDGNSATANQVQTVMIFRF